MTIERARHRTAWVVALGVFGCGATTAGSEGADVEVEVPPPPSASVAVVVAAPVRHGAEVEPPPPDSESIGIPECDAYVATMEMCSAKLPAMAGGAQAVRDAFKQVMQQSMTPDIRETLTHACTQGLQSLATVCK